MIVWSVILTRLVMLTLVAIGFAKLVAYFVVGALRKEQVNAASMLPPNTIDPRASRDRSK
jgi:hypothetical protein